jgi:AcrR family transcriptional regulator
MIYSLNDDQTLRIVYLGINIVGIHERKEREREMRRQQIIVAAKRVCSEKGIKRSTMENIASEAELSQRTLYQYFKNKDELYASLSLRILQDLQTRVEHVNRKIDLTPEQKVEKLIEAMHENNKIMSMILTR